MKIYNKICCADRIPNNSIPQIGVVYPDHWFGLLSGDTLENQQLCPFLFQYFGEPGFFCAIHNIKPVTCRVFDRKDCRRRFQDRGIHGN